MNHYLDFAMRLAGEIADGAYRGQEGLTWDGDDLDPLALSRDERVLVRINLDDGLLTGRTGVALGLACCAQLPDADPRWRALALEAASDAVRSAGSRGSLDALGWDVGVFGLARGATVIATRLVDQPLAAAASELAGRGLRAVLNEESLPPWPDLLGGVAGVLLGVATARLDAAAEADRVSAMRLLIDRLHDLAIVDGDGVRWPMATTSTPVVGLAHGGSGIALALTVAAKCLEGRRELRLVEADDASARARRLASGALRWEETQFDLTSGGWPDLRMEPPVPGLAWCHGAPGVGVAAALTGGREPGTRAAGVAHSNFIRAAQVLSGVDPGQGRFDGSLCHGLGGLIELDLIAAETWPSAATEHLRRARRLAEWVVAPESAWTCGVGVGGVTPNMLMGKAGVAMTMLRCADLTLAPSPADPTLAA